MHEKCGHLDLNGFLPKIIGLNAVELKKKNYTGGYLAN